MFCSSSRRHGIGSRVRRVRIHRITPNAAIAGLAIAVAAATGGLRAGAEPPTNAGGYPDWSAVADVPVIEVITHDEDGDARETKVWFVLLDGEPYLRTSGSRWLDNLRRDPLVGIRIEGTLYRARADEVTSDALIERVDAASRAKYGWQEATIHVFRMRRPDIVKLSPAPPGPEPGAP